MQNSKIQREKLKFTKINENSQGASHQRKHAFGKFDVHLKHVDLFD